MTREQISQINRKPVLGIQPAGDPGDWKGWMKKRFPLYLALGILTSCLGWGSETSWFARLLMQVFLSTSLTIVLWEGNARISDWLDSRISWLEHPARRVLWAVFIQTGYSLLASSLIVVPVLGLWQWYSHEVVKWKELMGGTAIVSVGITLIISVILTTRSFFIHWRASVIEAERLQNESLQMKMAALKTQLNPHFLFNSLNVLASLVGQENNPAQRFIEQLARIYRYVLDISQAEVVPVAREWEFIGSYLRLLKTRFGDNLSYELDEVPADNWGLAPMTLQVLVENAIKHNVISAARPLRIEIRVMPNQQLVVRNPFQPKADTGDSSGIGLANLKEQYLHLGGGSVRYGINGDFFEVYIPLLKMQKL